MKTIKVIPEITGSSQVNKNKLINIPRRSLLCLVSLLALILQVKAQDNSQVKQEEPPISKPFDVLDHMKPVKLNKSGQGISTRSTEIFGFDLQQAKVIYPAMVSTETIWIPNGKSNPKTLTVDRIDLKQLVPVLVAAIQQQQEEIAELKARLSKVDDPSKSSRVIEK